MAARIVCTTMALVLAACGFFGAAPEPPSPLDPFGILFLLVSGVVWFGWDMIGDAYAYREEICGKNKGAAYLMIVRLGPVLVNRLVRKNTD